MANHVKEQASPNAPAPQDQPADANQQPENTEFRAGSKNFDSIHPGSKIEGGTRCLDHHGSVHLPCNKHALAVQCFAKVFPEGFVEQYRNAGDKGVEEITGQTPMELLLNARARLEMGRQEAIAQQEAFNKEMGRTATLRACLQNYLRSL